MNKNVKTYIFTFGGLIVVFILCYLMASHIDRKLAFIIDGFEIAHVQTVTAGKNSGICFHQVPHDFMKITQNDESFRWEVNEDYQDSLQYFKINEINPNKHTIRNSDQQRISITLPPFASNTHDTLRLTLTGSEVWTFWEKFEKQTDVLSRWLAIKYQLEKAGCSHPDSLQWMAHLHNSAVRSFFHKPNNQLELVILDRFTTIDDNIRYTRKGETSALSDSARHFKLQFFGIGNYCYRNEEPEEGTFHIDGVNYVMKPYVKTTEWGAGHVMITSTGTGLKINFPKPVTFVANVDSLEKLSKRSSGIITMKQSNGAVPVNGDMYLPEFSNAINFDLCNLEFFHQNHSVTVRDNNYQTSTIENPLSLIPAFSKMSLHSGNDTLSVRTGFISKGFIFSYLWLPAIVLCVLLLLVWLPIVSPFKMRYADLDLLYNKDHIQNYKPYLTALLLICFAYCCCKSLIALKLSYTYPYFEKLTGIISMSTAMMMLLFFTLAMILNTRLLHFSNPSWRSIRLWGTWLGCFLLLCFLGYCFLGIMDTQINASILQSYLHSEINICNILEWMKPGAIQDTHRSVVYALLAVEALLIFLWAILNIFWKWIDKVSDKFLSVFSKKQTAFFFTRQVVILLIIVGIGVIGGNFSTAIITFFVILGLSDALSYAADRLTMGGHKSIGWLPIGMFSVTVVYIFFAFLPDHGYITNYFGFFLFFCFAFFLAKRPDTTMDSKAYKSIKSEKKWIVGSLIVSFSALTVLLPIFFYLIIDTEEVSYERYARRFASYIQFDNTQKSGYRYHESDAEFMVIMSHYMQNDNGNDPLSNDTHALHASISTGQSPVVLNDLSVPVAFIGSYGKAAPFVFFGLLFILAWLVTRYSIEYADNKPLFTKAMQWRMLAMCMWISTSFYIYLSYHSWLPFTGRLNPGFGVDAVGEALETAILLAFMACITCKKRKNIYNF